MKKFFSFLRKPKAKPNSGPRNRVLTVAEIAAQEEQKRKLAEQQTKAASRKKAQRTAKAAKPRNRILTEGESDTTGARPTRGKQALGKVNPYSYYVGQSREDGADWDTHRAAAPKGTPHTH